MIQPSWQTEILVAVGQKYNRTKYPRIKWIRRNRKSTSGIYYRRGNHITICAGTDDSQHTWVLLHELAHWLDRKSGHSKSFWKKAFELYEMFNVLTEEVKKREFGYMKTAQLVYNRRLQG